MAFYAMIVTSILMHSIILIPDATSCEKKVQNRTSSTIGIGVNTCIYLILKVTAIGHVLVSLLVQLFVSWQDKCAKCYCG